eukprot:Colp12_sorted_trinity150504_noHs@8814
MRSLTLYSPPPPPPPAASDAIPSAMSPLKGDSPRLASRSTLDPARLVLLLPTPPLSSDSKWASELVGAGGLMGRTCERGTAFLLACTAWWACSKSLSNEAVSAVCWLNSCCRVAPCACSSAMVFWLSCTFTRPCVASELQRRIASISWLSSWAQDKPEVLLAARSWSKCATLPMLLRMLVRSTGGRASSCCVKAAIFPCSASTCLLCSPRALSTARSLASILPFSNAISAWLFSTVEESSWLAEVRSELVSTEERHFSSSSLLRTISTSSNRARSSSSWFFCWFSLSERSSEAISFSFFARATSIWLCSSCCWCSNTLFRDSSRFRMSTSHLVRMFIISVR